MGFDYCKLNVIHTFLFQLVFQEQFKANQNKRIVNISWHIIIKAAKHFGWNSTTFEPTQSFYWHWLSNDLDLLLALTFKCPWLFNVGNTLKYAGVLVGLEPLKGRSMFYIHQEFIIRNICELTERRISSAREANRTACL